MTHFVGVSDTSNYLSLFEKQIVGKNIVKEGWLSYVLSFLPLEIINIIAREQTPEVNSATSCDFAFGLRNYFEE